MTGIIVLESSLSMELVRKVEHVLQTATANQNVLIFRRVEAFTVHVDVSNANTIVKIHVAFPLRVHTVKPDAATLNAFGLVLSAARVAADAFQLQNQVRIAWE
jgi:hypothetical protein